MEQSQYTSLTKWKQADNSLYDLAKRKGLIQTICDRFGWENTSVYPFGRKQYDEEEIIEIARKSKSFEAFTTKNRTAYSEAKRLNILLKVKENIGKAKKKNLYTKEYVFELAKDCSHYYIFKSKHAYAYNMALKNNWEEELYQFFCKKEWDEGKDVRLFCAFTQSSEFLNMFEEFKEKNKNNPLLC